MKKALLLLANGFEEVEALSPADYLRRAGTDLIIAATGTDERTIEGSHKISVNTDTTLNEYLSSHKETPDALVIPGGLRGAKNISECKVALDLIEKMVDEGKIVAAICASPAVVLGKTKVLKGKKWTCYPEMEKETPNEIQANHEEKPFVTDGNLVTGRGAGTAEQFSMEIVRLLFGEETKEKIMKGTVQRDS